MSVPGSVGGRCSTGTQLTFRDGQGGAPLVSENVETNTAVAVDVGVVDASGEVDLGRLEGVVGGEMDGEEEYAARVWRVALIDSLSGSRVKYVMMAYL